MQVPTPFHLPMREQRACEQALERDLQLSMRQAFTIGDSMCLMDIMPPACDAFANGMDFLDWAQKMLGTLHCLLACLLNLKGSDSQQKQPSPESSAARGWYAQFARLHNAPKHSAQLRVQIQHFILHFPALVGDHVSLFPNLCFEDKQELMCSLAFSACKILLRPFWSPQMVRQCTDLSPKAMARFHASWQQPLYRKVASKATEGSFAVRVLDAYQQPIARLMDHYHFYELLLSTSFPI